MKKNESNLSNFKTYEEDILSLMPSAPNSPNTNIWVKGNSMEIPGKITVTGTNQEIKIRLCESKNWPETKTIIETVCRIVLGVRICTDLPVFYKRICKKRFDLVIKHPDLNSVKSEVEDCVKSSAAVAIAILVSSGNIALALSTFKSSFISCLKIKGVQIANEISLNITEKKQCGPWKHIT